jgi:DNA-binding MarR family transcriptional regulator
MATMKRSKERELGSSNTDSEYQHLGVLTRQLYLHLTIDIMKRLAEEEGYTDIKPAHSVVFQFIHHGSRITDMAERAGTTKQNMSYLTEYLEQRGYIERSPDPEDGRASIFKMTPKGIALRARGRTMIREREQEWEKKLGTKKMQRLRTLLLELNTIINNQRL